ncbi:MAG TPA: sensor histidine kinase [Actinomycetota bacterium]|nr:sensor histidine kinase [Actinomycetota bacterium]
MVDLDRLARERTDLTGDEIAYLHLLIADWTLLADLSFSDLVMWLPTWNGAGFVAVAQVRPSTGPTVYPEDVVGSFAAKGRLPEVERAFHTPRIVRDRLSPDSLLSVGPEAIPVHHGERIIAVIARRSGLSPREPGELERTYREIADVLAGMLASGVFPVHGMQDSSTPPRVGDGLIRLNAQGMVTFASPNARSAFRRMGVMPDLAGRVLEQEVRRLAARTGPVDESIGILLSGRGAGSVDIEVAEVTVSIRAIPLRADRVRTGALLLIRDVTDLRRGERALLTKDNAIREIHHRVKNNLQTVAALLRMQGRRLQDESARAALDESVRRVSAIALVHETLSRADADAVEFDDVADRLVAMVADLAAGVVVRREGQAGILPGSIATSLALVVAELLQNASEHGGQAVGGGHILLTAERRGRRLRVSVVDDGPGLPAGFDPRTHARLGLRIVETLVRDELHGSLSWEPGVGGRGTVATVDLVVPTSR